MMWKRSLPLSCAVLLSAFAFAPLARPAHVADDPVPVVAAAAAEDTAVDATQLTDLEREMLRAAQQDADPGLGEMRAGAWGLVVVILLVILIFAVAD